MWKIEPESVALAYLSPIWIRRQCAVVTFVRPIKTSYDDVWCSATAERAHFGPSKHRLTSVKEMKMSKDKYQKPALRSQWNIHQILFQLWFQVVLSRLFLAKYPR